jgi:peptidoglycan hydrolase-like protein with peptidoglycan-binding domain
VLHWFPKHGKSMDTFRADVKALLDKEMEPVAVETVSVKLNVLKKGSTGEQVEVLQRILSTHGYKLGNNNPYDGKFGDLTDKAVRSFQKDNCRYVDGVVGAETWSVLLGV